MEGDIVTHVTNTIVGKPDDGKVVRALLRHRRDAGRSYEAQVIPAALEAKLFFWRPSQQLKVPRLKKKLDLLRIMVFAAAPDEPSSIFHRIAAPKITDLADAIANWNGSSKKASSARLLLLAKADDAEASFLRRQLFSQSAAVETKDDDNEKSPQDADALEEEEEEKNVSVWVWREAFVLALVDFARCVATEDATKQEEEKMASAPKTGSGKLQVPTILGRWTWSSLGLGGDFADPDRCVS